MLPAAGRVRDDDDPGPGYTSFSGAGVEIVGDLGGWTPGNSPTRLPQGVGRLVPRGADLIVQVHYHPDGRPEVDRTSVGIYLAKGPIRQTIHWANASNYDFKLPAGKKDIEVKATWFVPVDVDALAVTPHMHAPGTRRSDLRDVPRRPQPRSPPYRRLGPRLAKHLLFRVAHHAAQRLDRENGRPLR